MEETEYRPKPMVEIGGKPILWHIMKSYAAHGVDEFIVCLGYKGYMIKEYFANYFLHMSDVSLELATNTRTVHNAKAESWKVTLVDTGSDTMTGGRIKRIAGYLDQEDFCLTYGDAVSTVDIGKLIAFHKTHGRAATITAVRPPARFGALDLRDDLVAGFIEKPAGDNQWINGGYFMLSPRVLATIEDDFTVWEERPLQMLAASGELMAYRHAGFWQPMDTLRDKRLLERLWQTGAAPWRTD